MKKKIFALLALVALFLTACQSGQQTDKDPAATAGKQAAARSLAEIKDSGKIRIGVFADKMPFGYVDDKGQPQGYDIELAKKIGEDLLGSADKVEFVPMDAASRAEFLKSGKVDITLANFTVTDERREQVDFALPYMKVAIGVVSPEKGLVTDINQLKDKKLILVKGTTAENYFQKEAPDIKNIDKYDAYQEAYDALRDGRGDAFSTDNTEVLAWANENPGFKVGIESLGQEDTIAPAVQKGNQELKDYLDDLIVRLGQDHFFTKAYDKTCLPVYGKDVDPKQIVLEGDDLKAYYDAFNYAKK
ncbi:cysteine ABC transporter substrate-binding protein [Aerococcus sp. UMB1112A]|uniref:cysteine ABC transporter substrate-binding protein n=1 Tax=unclassified Aerococcus TaxID=2618060 RepID=UPI00254E4720|nr:MULTISPECIES: cysteine ABC transporter substrate-binding protein [unclassified Aerococcus]MDK6805871.1 cysteine ABC transporter substrate-binding protein [Aerococcus sp. UMB7834]MDK8502567.1 cysteine ABC transporter substrate-binding protein [Aerococcus sp. UMB1112A]